MFRKNVWAAVCLIAAFASLPVQGRDLDGDLVYTLTNAAHANAVLVYRQASTGALTPVETVFTGGKGAGAGLGSQGALALSASHRWLLAVNAGSNDISVFRASDEGITLASRTPSGGTMPISVTIYGHVVYVLNAGMPNNIAGFMLGSDGSLTPIAGSIQPLSTASAGPAQVQFSKDGERLVVTEKATNLIDVFPVMGGVAGPPVINASSGMTPFGFAFGRLDRLFVSEAFGGAPGASAISSYDVLPSNMLQVISGSVPTSQTAACWLVIHPSGRFGYTTNTGSKTVSLFHIGPDGSVTIDGTPGTTPAGAPIDATFSSGATFLNVLTTGAGTIVSFKVQLDGSLQKVGTVTAPPTAAGLAAQ